MMEHISPCFVGFVLMFNFFLKNSWNLVTAVNKNLNKPVASCCFCCLFAKLIHVYRLISPPSCVLLRGQSTFSFLCINESNNEAFLDQNLSSDTKTFITPREEETRKKKQVISTIKMFFKAGSREKSWAQQVSEVWWVLICQSELIIMQPVRLQTADKMLCWFFAPSAALDVSVVL